MEDRVTAGYELWKKEPGGVSFNMAGSFLLFRGAQMKEEWIKPYVGVVGQEILLPGNNSCS